MENEITLAANCPNCGGRVTVYVVLIPAGRDRAGVQIVGKDAFGIFDAGEFIVQASIGEHACPPLPCPECSFQVEIRQERAADCGLMGRKPEEVIYHGC